jgi:hypothetical protein
MADIIYFYIYIFNNFYFSLIIITAIKSRSMIFAGHVAAWGNVEICTLQSENHKGDNFGRHSRKCENNVKVEYNKIVCAVCVVWITIAPNRDKLRTLS